MTPVSEPHLKAPDAPVDRRGPNRFRPWAESEGTAAVRRWARNFPAVGADEARVTAGDRVRRAALHSADVAGVLLAVLTVSALTSLPLRALGTAVAIVIVTVFVQLNGLSEKDQLVLRRSTLDDAPKLAEAAGLAACGYWLSLPEGPGRLPLLMLMVALCLAPLTLRLAARLSFRRLIPPERCLFVGDPRVADRVCDKVTAVASGARVVGVVLLDEKAGPTAFGGIDGLRRIVGEAEVTRVIIAPVSVSAADTLDLIRVAKELHVRVSIVPRLFEVVGTAVEHEELEGLMLMGVRRFGLSRGAHALKRTFDLALGGLMMIAAFPAIAVLAALIKLDSRGPVFFRQMRVGRDGQHFEILKFRSMVPDAEALKPGLRAVHEEGGLFKLPEDPRVTRVGRLLRKMSLDELPQLVNVMRGEMSLVGPRPLVLDEDLLIRGLDRRRLHLTPGMTGPWQIMRSGRVPMEEMVAIDYLYASSWSLWSDVKVLLRTVSYVTARRGL